MSAHPDAQTFAADRLMEGERLVLAAAAGPLALLVTQIGTIAAADPWLKALASICFLSFAYCCIWQVRVINYATYWLAQERMGQGGHPGLSVLQAYAVDTTYSESRLAELVRQSKLHVGLSYWAGGISGGAAVLGVIWW